MLLMFCIQCCCCCCRFKDADGVDDDVADVDAVIETVETEIKYSVVFVCFFLLLLRLYAACNIRIEVRPKKKRATRVKYF